MNLLAQVNIPGCVIAMPINPAFVQMHGLRKLTMLRRSFGSGQKSSAFFPRVKFCCVGGQFTGCGHPSCNRGPIPDQIRETQLRDN